MNFNYIGIELPEGTKPERFELVGNTLRVYLRQEKSKWEVHEIIYKDTPSH